MVKRFRNRIPTYSDLSPEFFKIFVPGQCSKQLRIPPAFLKYFKRIRSFKSILSCPGKRLWPVDVNMVDDNLYFQSGWEQFVQDNSLGFGDFLVFCLIGESKFCVSIYGKNRCQKEVFNASKNCNKELVNQKIELGKSKEVAAVAGAEQVDTVAPRAIKSENPVFEIMLRPSFMKRGIEIPQIFRRGLKVHRGYAKFQNSSKAWLVKLSGDLDSRIRFSTGWREFVEDNSLCAGNVCSFELIDTERDMYVMNVSILRACKKTSRTTVEYF